MISNGVGVQYPSIESILGIYGRHGFDVVRYRRAGEEGVGYHRLRFLGRHPDTGDKAIRVANAHGLRLVEDAALQEWWTVYYEDGVDGAMQDTSCHIWEMGFEPMDRGYGRGAIECDCELERVALHHNT